MEQNIQDFYKEAYTQDFARIFQFRLESFPGLGEDDNRLIFVESLNVPGRAINNIPVPFMGLQFNVPGTALYPGSDAWSVTFRCDADYNIRQLLEDETARIFNDTDSRGEYSIPKPEQVMVLNLLDDQFKTKRQYKFFGTYVVSIGDVAYDIGDGGNLVKIPVTLAYQFWRVSEGVSRLGG